MELAHLSVLYTMQLSVMITYDLAIWSDIEDKPQDTQRRAKTVSCWQISMLKTHEVGYYPRFPSAKLVPVAVSLAAHCRHKKAYAKTVLRILY
jgi:hypothetical protein